MQKKSDPFWLSYSDLMTSLFFIMLVLFVLVYSLMNYEKNKLKLKLSEYEKIEEIKSALENLDSRYFQYDEINKRHELKVSIEFTTASDVIKSQYHKELYQAGLALQSVMDSIHQDGFDVKYLIIIEGMAAKYTSQTKMHRNQDKSEIDFTYELSYRRAKALYQFWQSRGIEFDEDVFEIILAGSGWYGTGRYPFRDPEEGKNKRFLIQVLPKVGELQDQDEQDI